MRFAPMIFMLASTPSAAVAQLATNNPATTPSSRAASPTVLAQQQIATIDGQIAVIQTKLADRRTTDNDRQLATLQLQQLVAQRNRVLAVLTSLLSQTNATNRSVIGNIR